jgi:hypothetical protein
MLIFDPEDGGDTFLRNVGSYTDYTVLYPKKMATFVTTAVKTSTPILTTFLQTLSPVQSEQLYPGTTRTGSVRLMTDIEPINQSETGNMVTVQKSSPNLLQR